MLIYNRKLLEGLRFGLLKETKKNRNVGNQSISCKEYLTQLKQLNKNRFDPTTTRSF